MQKIIFLIIGSLLSVSLSAQQVQEQSLYMLNPFLLNPAFAGSGNGLVSMLGYRSGYTGLNGAPRNLYLSAHAPIAGKASLGANLFNDSRGALNTVSGSVAASYLVKVAAEHNLRFGLSGGFYKHSVQANKVKNVNTEDPTLFSSNTNFTNYNFGFGAAYTFKNLDLGIALPDLVHESKLLRNYTNVYARYNYTLPDKQWKISPVVLFQQLPVSPNQFDTQVMVTWQDQVWVQAGYRFSNSGLFSAGVNLGAVSVAYAYQANTGERNEIAKGGHEIVLMLCLKGRKEKPDSLHALFENDTLTEPTVEKPAIDTVNYAHRIEQMDKQMALQKSRLDSIVAASRTNNENYDKEHQIIQAELAQLEDLKKELANYLKEVHDFSDSSHVDIAMLEEFDLKHYDYHVAIGTYSNINYVKFLQKQMLSHYDIQTVIEHSDDKKFYILSTKKVTNKDEALKEIHYLNNRIHEQYFDESARVVRKSKI